MEAANNDQPAPKPAEPSERLSLDDLKQIADVNVERIERRNEGKSLERPYRNDRGAERPYRRSEKSAGRERTPFDKKDPK